MHCHQTAAQGRRKAGTFAATNAFQLKVGQCYIGRPFWVGVVAPDHFTTKANVELLEWCGQWDPEPLGVESIGRQPWLYWPVAISPYAGA
ncbi:MAG: hypothetical protein ACLQM8_25775 [Limisphaerales bacterium]